MVSLQQRLDDFKKAFDSGAPPLNAPREAIDKMHRATAELKATGIENRRIKGRRSCSELPAVQPGSRGGGLC